MFMAPSVQPLHPKLLLLCAWICLHSLTLSRSLSLSPLSLFWGERLYTHKTMRRRPRIARGDALGQDTGTSLFLSLSLSPPLFGCVGEGCDEGGVCWPMLASALPQAIGDDEVVDRRG
jgi:hypothetical protein